MVTSIYTADVKLNKKQNSYLKSLLIVNENGLIILDNRLFNVYFASEMLPKQLKNYKK